MELSHRKAMAARLRQARKAAGYSTARDFATAYKIPESTYSQRETGKRALTVTTLEQYAKAFNVSVHWLLTGEEGFMQKPTPIDLVREMGGAVDLSTLSDLLREFIPIATELREHYSLDELINLITHTYNRVVVASLTQTDRIAMIRLSFSSALREAREAIVLA